MMSEATPEIEYARSDTPQPWTVAAAFIALRLLGIYLVVRLLLDVAANFEVVRSQVRSWGAGFNADNASLLLSLAMPIVLASLLIVYARPLAMRLMPFQGMRPSGVNPEQVIALGTVLIGLWTCVSIMPYLITEFFACLQRIQEQSQSKVESADSWILVEQYLISYILQLAIGLFLFFRPMWVVGQFRKRSRM